MFNDYLIILQNFAFQVSLSEKTFQSVTKMCSETRQLSVINALQLNKTHAKGFITNKLTKHLHQFKSKRAARHAAWMTKDMDVFRIH